jgi:hypothetical protein|tara:strand:+ start:537 stop:770 length:234 start_codon:yes stop_codon:yes gene_type:complete
MKSFRQFRQNIQERFEKDIHEDYRKDIIFSEGDWVQHMSNGKTGKVIRRGPNYVIALTEEQKIFRAWVKDLQEHSVL